ncbi:MAG: phosphomannomutase/phosphoglucomutase [Deltaproteobacteria bacterium]|nr:phosphomannomutase/phosphoglucomutase [Deltaproteobacteria bacterium]
MNAKIFREYDIRGVAEQDLTDPVVEDIGRAIGTHIKKIGGKKMSLGRDCRKSSQRLRNALSKGLLSTGIDVVDIGLVPTPLLYYSVLAYKQDGGVMITGSHNPPEHNGFKVAVGNLTIHGSEIQELRQIIESQDFAQGKGSLINQDIKDEYIAMVEAGIPHPLNVRVVVDSGNGMGGLVAPQLFRRLGCEVIELYSDPDGSFPNHHPDPTVLDNLKVLKEFTIREKAMVGIGFDGDADRIGVVDPSGRIIYGDELLILYARQILKHNPGATIISEVKASRRLFEDIKVHGGKPLQWKTGHSLIKAKMKEVGALAAGEMSGHMFFKDRYHGFDDAIYAAARLLEILNESKKTASELLADLPVSFTTPEIRVNCPDDVKFDVVGKARKHFEQLGYSVNGIDGARIEFEDGWGLVRASNTQPVLVFRFEATTEKRLKEIQQLVEKTVQRLLT